MQLDLNNLSEKTVETKHAAKDYKSVLKTETANRVLFNTKRVIEWYY